MNETRKTNADLQCQRDTLREQLNLLDGVLRESQRLQLDAENRASEQIQINQACQLLVERQEQALHEQGAELRAAEAAARKLGDMVDDVVSANDFAAAAFQGAVDVADLMMRNQYLEAELADQTASQHTNEAEGVEASGTVPAGSPTLCKSDTNVFTIIANLVIQIQSPAKETRMCRWKSHQQTLLIVLVKEVHMNNGVLTGSFTRCWKTICHNSEMVDSIDSSHC